MAKITMIGRVNHHKANRCPVPLDWRAFKGPILGRSDTCARIRVLMHHWNRFFFFWKHYCMFMSVGGRCLVLFLPPEIRARRWWWRWWWGRYLFYIWSSGPSCRTAQEGLGVECNCEDLAPPSLELTKPIRHGNLYQIRDNGRSLE